MTNYNNTKHQRGCIELVCKSCGITRLLGRDYYRANRNKFHGIYQCKRCRMGKTPIFWDKDKLQYFIKCQSCGKPRYSATKHKAQVAGFFDSDRARPICQECFRKSLIEGHIAEAKQLGVILRGGIFSYTCKCGFTHFQKTIWPILRFAQGKTKCEFCEKLKRNKLTFKNLDGEKWRQVPDFPNYYISNHGRMRNQHYHILRPQSVSTRRQYHAYILYNGKTKTKKLVYGHRAVAMAFLKNIRGLSDVDHHDRNTLNNHVSNLAWVSHATNQKLAMKDGLFRGHPNAVNLGQAYK